MAKFYLPRVSISTWWDHGEIALLTDFWFKTPAECRSWGLSQWGNMIPFGMYFEGVFELDDDIENQPLNIQGKLTIYNIAIIAGRTWDKEFPEATPLTFDKENVYDSLPVPNNHADFRRLTGD